MDLGPELRISSNTTGSQPWTTLDLAVFVGAVQLHLYDADATSKSSLKDHGIARFALNENTLRFKLLSDGAGEAQVTLRSFTMSNTRPGISRFREIIPAAQHDRHQFMVLYSMSSGSSSASSAIVTIDSPQIIFAIDPVIAVLEFFESTFSKSQPLGHDERQPVRSEWAESSESRKIDFRADLHDLCVSVLENDANPESHSIRFSVQHILVSQQVVFTCSFLINFTHQVHRESWLSQYSAWGCR